MCLSNLPRSWSPSSGEQSCLCSSSLVLSDCSLSFCLPATRMRRYNKSFLNLRLWCHSFFLPLSNLSQFITLREEETVADVQRGVRVCARAHTPTPTRTKMTSPASSPASAACSASSSSSASSSPSPLFLTDASLQMKTCEGRWLNESSSITVSASELKGK